ncbi:MAG TPA: hypothetical protein VMU83_04420 [Hanamia sp.]|nr:hypothetical protein [Hanamia sp.]
MFKRLFTCIFISIMLFAPFLSIGQNVNNKKLIEFGWNYPNVSFLKANISSMEKAPFDGVVFSFDFDIYNAFDTTQYPDSKFQYNDLSEIQWKKFTDNFLLVRGVGHTGAHWLDDKSWLKITENLKKVSEALKISKAKGIGFDPEFYYKDSTLNPWIYKPSLYDNLSYQQVGNYVRKRGKQFIQALQTNKPDVKILCFWLLVLPYFQSINQPIAETGMALYPFFIEGMLEGKNKTSEIIDGNENSYGFQKAETYITSAENLRDIGSKMIKKSLQSEFSQVSYAQAIFFDLIYAKLPKYDKGFDKQTKETWLADNLYNAYKTTDKYVWFYDERMNWWKGEIDSGVAKIIQDVRNKINKEQNNKANEISGKSLYYDFAPKQHESGQEFFYNYTKSKNSLQINLLNSDIKRLRIFNNSRLIYDINSPSLNFTIDLNKKYNRKNNLIILTTDSKGEFSVAYVN